MTRLKRPFSRRRKLLRTHKMEFLIALFFGVIIGLSFSYVSRQCFLRIANVKCELLKPKDEELSVPTRSGETFLNLSMELKASKYFLLIGVMTADRYISTRAKTIRDTWSNSVGDSVRVVFFSGILVNTSVDFDVVRLPGVSDTDYPPQKKSFFMLQYVYKNYINEFHWFVRADDDVYIRTGKLSEWLHSFNSSDDLLFGQAGVGKSHEKGKLGLKDGDNFCIGGVGVVMSQSVVRKVAPYVLTCLNRTATLHEDSELGRCIRQHVNVMCPWALEVRHLFYQNFGTPEKVFSTSLRKSPFRNAITVHPIKDPTHMIHLHHHFLTSDFLKLQHRAAILNLRMRNIRNLLQDSKNKTRHFQKSYFYGLLPFNSTLHWEFFTNQYLYGLSETPLSWVSGSISAGITKLKSRVMSNINTEAHRLLESQEELKKLHLATIRTHPTMGIQLTVNIETLLKSLTSIHRRSPRRAQHFSHFQQTFAPLWRNTLGEILTPEPTINFIMPLAERFQAFKTFLRFLNSFAEAFINPGLPVSLLIVYFPDVSPPERYKKVFEKFSAKHPNVQLIWSEMFGRFSRAAALEFGVDRYGNESLLFFADVDLIFRTEFYHRCRAGTVLGQRVYFPIMFSQFNPQIVYHNQSAPSRQTSSKGTPTLWERQFTKRTGVWRKYSYGPVCVYMQDFIAAGRLNTSIQGWGLEDLDFYEKCLRHNLHVFRAPDLGLVHVYHAQASCADPRMNKEQVKMCEDSRRQGIGSKESLVDYMLAKGYI